MAARQAKLPLEIVPRVDVRDLKAAGVLIDGDATWFGFRSPSGRMLGEANVEIHGESLLVRYTRTGDSEQHVQLITLVGQPCYYGGYRTLLKCPDCERRVVALYCTHRIFRCRHCERLTYLSRRKQAHERGLMMAQDIREKLGGSRNLLEPFPVRPKNMHRAIYEKFRRRAQEFEARWTQGLGELRQQRTLAPGCRGRNR